MSAWSTDSDEPLPWTFDYDDVNGAYEVYDGATGDTAAVAEPTGYGTRANVCAWPAGSPTDQLATNLGEFDNGEAGAWAGWTYSQATGRQSP